MSTRVPGVTDAVVVDFDALLQRFTERYLSDLDDLRRKHDLSDEQVAQLLRERFGDMDDVWLEWCQDGEGPDR